MYLSGGACWVVLGFWSLVVNVKIIEAVAGFWGFLLAFVFFPIALTATPLYAFFVYGDSGPAVLSYGGTIIGFALVGLGSVLAEAPPARGVVSRIGRFFVAAWAWLVFLIVFAWLFTLVFRTPSWWATYAHVGDFIRIWSFVQILVLCLPLGAFAFWATRQYGATRRPDPNDGAGCTGPLEAVEAGPLVITRDAARRIAEDYLAQNPRLGGIGIREVVGWDEMDWARPRLYGVTDEALARCWICYLARPDDGGWLRSSLIIAVDRERSKVIYAGSAHDEG
jgi:hypothetical protein